MKFFTALVFIAISSLAQAQTDILIENIDCPSGQSDISFDLTITDNGVPISSLGSFYFTLENEMGDDLFNFEFFGRGVIIDNLPVNGTLESGHAQITLTCDDIIGTNVTGEVVNIGSINNDLIFSKSFPNFGVVPVTAPTPDPIPTLGEWALIVLGLIIVAIGLVSLKSRKEAIS